MIASILSIALLIGLASATLTISGVTELDQDGSSFSFNIASTENETVNFSLNDITNGGRTITFTAPSDITINDTVAQSITVNYNVETGFDFDFGDVFETTLTAQGTTSNAITQVFKFQESDFCLYSNPGELRVRVTDVKVTEGFGEDDEWFPMDQIEVEIEIENKGDEDIDDIAVEWGLYSNENDEWVIEVDDLKDFNLKDGDEEVKTISFTIDDDMDVDLNDLQDGSYTIYVKATGDVDISPSEETCTSDTEDVTIIIESDFVVLSDFENLDTVQCGTEFQLIADAWNIGDDDQEDVYVKVFNRELNINERIELGDIDAFEKEGFEFNFMLPDDAEEKRYSLTLSVYDDNDDVYENDFDDESAVFDLAFDLQGNCAKPSAVVSASLYEGGEAGKTLSIKSTIMNSGEKSTTYLLNAAGYAEWASTARLEQSTFTLNSGESREVMITFDVKDGIEGEKTFNIEILADNELIVNQPVAVNIVDKGFNFPSIGGSNWHLWAIGALNVILVIFIIVIAIRIARR